MRSTFIRIALFSGLLLTYVGMTADAQTSPTQDDPLILLQNRASEVVSTLMQRTSQRTAEFNSQMGKINLLRPLDGSNLTPERIPVSLKKIGVLLDFLNTYRDSTKFLVHFIEDSVAEFRSEMPRNYQESFMSTFLNAYKEDAEQFDAYTQTITALHTQVSELLQFIQHSKYKVTEDGLEFTSQDDYTKYKSYMEVLDKKNGDLKKQAAKAQLTQKAVNAALETLFANPAK